MKLSIAKTVSVALSVMLSAGLCAATDSKAPSPKPTVSQATSSAANTKSQKVNTAPKVKLVDINSAQKDELKKLPGIGDAQAEKIMAGRPYGSKAHLITRNVLERGTYDAVNQLVVAKPTKQLLDKVAALNKKKE